MAALNVTLAYFLPTRPLDRRHSAAEPFVRADRDSLRIMRQDANWRTMRRGSVQHEDLAGDEAAAFIDGAVLNVQVNCRSTVSSIKERVGFGLAVTLGSTADVPIYAPRLHARAQARV